MKFSPTVVATALIALFTSSAVAVPASASPTTADAAASTSTSTCLTSPIATQIVSQFTSLLTAYNNNTANSLLSPTHFVENSSSINFFIGQPVDAVTFPNRAAFEQGVSHSPSITLPFVKIDAVTCEGVIAFRFEAGVGQNNTHVKGIDILHTSVAAGGSASKVGTGGWQINRVYSEFDSAVWDIALGGKCTPPTQ